MAVRVADLAVERAVAGAQLWVAEVEGRALAVARLADPAEAAKRRGSRREGRRGWGAGCEEASVS